MANEKKPKVRAKRSHKVLWTILSVLVGIVVVLYVLSRLGVPQRNLAAMKVGDQKVTIAEYNYYYNNQKQTIAHNLNIPAYQLDLKAENPFNSEEMGKTWGEYLDKATQQQIQQVYIKKDQAEKMGIELTDEDESAIQSNLDVLRYNFPNEAQMRTYLEQSYGVGVTPELIEKIERDNFMSRKFDENYRDSLEFTDDELETFYEQSPEEYMVANYHLIEVNTKPEHAQFPGEFQDEAEADVDETAEEPETQDAEAEEAAEEDEAAEEAEDAEEAKDAKDSKDAKDTKDAKEPEAADEKKNDSEVKDAEQADEAKDTETEEEAEEAEAEDTEAAETADTEEETEGEEEFDHAKEARKAKVLEEQKEIDDFLALLDEKLNYTKDFVSMGAKYRDRIVQDSIAVRNPVSEDDPTFFTKSKKDVFPEEIREWLFDESREKLDLTRIDSEGSTYYVLFLSAERDATPTADISYRFFPLINQDRQAMTLAETIQVQRLVDDYVDSIESVEDLDNGPEAEIVLGDELPASEEDDEAVDAEAAANDDEMTTDEAEATTEADAEAAEEEAPETEAEEAEATVAEEKKEEKPADEAEAETEEAEEAAEDTEATDDAENAEDTEDTTTRTMPLLSHGPYTAEGVHRGSLLPDEIRNAALSMEKDDVQKVTTPNGIYVVYCTERGPQEGWAAKAKEGLATDTYNEKLTFWADEDEDYKVHMSGGYASWFIK